MTRVLIVRLGALGDIVHAIPVAAALRRAHPSLRIDWLVSARHRAMLDLVPVVDRRIVINDRRGASGGLSIPAVARELRASRYDVAFDLQGLIKSAVLARLSGAPRVIGFARRHLREPLAGLFYTERHDPGGGGLRGAEPRHVIAINLSLLECVGIHAAAPELSPEFPITFSPEFPIDTAESAATGALVADVLERTKGRFALLNPGAAWPNKRWPPERFAHVARAVSERHGLMSAVLWGPSERPLGERLVEESRGAAVLVPETTVAGIVALARRAEVMVSGDTGPTHIASAVGTPIVGLYGPTRPERNGPWRRDDIALSRAGTCECHHLRQCKRERMCLLDIHEDEVIDAVERRLTAAASDGGRARASAT